jgi:hypothetical protein
MIQMAMSRAKKSYISTYAATFHVLSFEIIGNIHWPHDPVFTLRKMSHATLWQAAEEIGTTFDNLSHYVRAHHLADAATAKTVTPPQQQAPIGCPQNFVFMPCYVNN